MKIIDTTKGYYELTPAPSLEVNILARIYEEKCAKFDRDNAAGLSPTWEGC